MDLTIKKVISSKKNHTFFIDFKYLNLQVISTCPKDSKVIEDYGGNRIQLVSALEIGGITPSPALLRKSLEISNLKTMVMVRHHNQGFVLNKEQKQLLVEEAVSLIDFGCKGIVLGAITQNNQIDQSLLAEISSKVSINKIDITFHKASDYLHNLPQAYKTLANYNISRVLTQGGLKKIEQNYDVLKEVIHIGGIKTLVGGGINLQNVSQIIKALRPEQIHIGTCVRRDKYGGVEGHLVEKFVEKISKV